MCLQICYSGFMSRDPFTNLDAITRLAEQQQRVLRQFEPLLETVRRTEEAMRPLLEAAQKHQEIGRRLGAAFQVNTPALEWTTALAAPQLEAAAAIRSTLAGSGVLDRLNGLTDFTSQWRGIFDSFEKITNILPPDAFGNIDQIAESLRVAMPTVPAIDPAVFGRSWNADLAGAYQRLRARAEEVANDPEAGVEDVAAVVAEVEAVKASTPPEARATMDVQLKRVTLWLLREVAKDAAKKAVYTAIFAMVVVLWGLTEPTLPALPAQPVLFPPEARSRPGELSLPRDWQIKGLPDIITRAGPKASQRTLEFFTAQIRNPNTRQAYAQAVMRFFNWCDDRNLELADILPFTVAAYVEEMQREYAAPTVKQHLAAIRMSRLLCRRSDSADESSFVGARAAARREERQNAGATGRTRRGCCSIQSTCQSFPACAIARCSA